MQLSYLATPVVDTVMCCIRMKLERAMTINDDDFCSTSSNLTEAINFI